MLKPTSDRERPDRHTRATRVANSFDRVAAVRLRVLNLEMRPCPEGVDA